MIGSGGAKGFTIVELLIVIVVVGILATISIVAYRGVQSRAHNTAVRSDLTNNMKLLTGYKTLNDTYPITRAEFREVGLKFALDSHQHSTYCVWENVPEPEVIIVSRSFGGETHAMSSRTGLQPYTASFPNPTGVCTNAGPADPTAAVWLRGSAWTNWVVY